MNESGQTEEWNKKPLEKRFAPKSAAAFGWTGAEILSIQPALLPSHCSQSVFLGHLSHSTLLNRLRTSKLVNHFVAKDKLLS